MERETGIEPATLCLEGLGSRNPSCPDTKPSISVRLSPLLPGLIIPLDRRGLLPVNDANLMLSGQPFEFNLACVSEIDVPAAVCQLLQQG